MPCLSMDFYELYVEWCRRQGLKALNFPRFANELKRKHSATTERKRVGPSSNPRMVINLPGGHEKPDGEHESDWLEARCDVFRNCLKDFKGHVGIPA